MSRVAFSEFHQHYRAMDNHISILLVDAHPTDRILRRIDERDILATGIVVRQVDADRLGRDVEQ